MRVISQNGAIDVPYEMTAFHLAGRIIYMNMVGDTGKGTLMAQYDSSENAQKAMDMLRLEYTGIMPSLMIDKGANLKPEDMETLKKSLTGAIIKPAEQGNVEVHMLPRIFRFPADDEIEVEE